LPNTNPNFWSNRTQRDQRQWWLGPSKRCRRWIGAWSRKTRASIWDIKHSYKTNCCDVTNLRSITISTQIAIVCFRPTSISSHPFMAPCKPKPIL
jgi:hypothetical protein